MKPIKRISLTLLFLFIALAFTIQIGYSTTQTTFTLDLSNPIFRYEENALNDTNTTKDVIFSGSQNKTEFITIPKNSTILNATIMLTGKITPAQQTGTGVAYYSVAVGNVTGGSYKDVAIGTANKGIFLFNSSLNQIWNYSINNQVISIAIGNILADNGDEIAVAAYDQSRVYLLNSSGNQKWNYTTASFAYSVAIGNVTPDNQNEIVVGSDRIYLLNSTGGLNWTYTGSGTV
ncbi:MAG: hypothetical protein NTW30_01945, partial [Candidatus Aenigmarchaeota archaeon]|nr:hypothetical protein [Candidatus Aenigmarchaeota archaeon]